MDKKKSKHYLLGQLPDCLVDIENRESYRLVEVPSGRVYSFNNILDALTFANKYCDCCDFRLETISQSIKTYAL